MELSNSSLCYFFKDFKGPYNISEFSNITSVANAPSETKAMGLGAVTGILIVFFINVFLSYECNKSSASFKNGFYKIFNGKNFSRTVLLTLLVLILPFIVFFFMVALLYKIICSVIIMKKDKYFVSFLDSFDVFWSLEDDSTKSIINVLGVIESDSPFTLAANIKEKLRNIVLNEASKKIFYRRNEKYGFYYWREYSIIDMDQYVEIVEVLEEDQSPGKTDLENLMTELQDKPLPYADEGLFKIFITENRINKYDEAKGEYGIVFRIHHSVGDGVALIEFLCKSFADDTDNCSINMFSMPENCNHDAPQNLLGMIRKLLEIPICFVDGILRKPDDNALHGASLVGKKVFKWTKSDENLLTMVKGIKESVQHINFTDILITALSKGLNDLLAEQIATVPDDVAVVLPVRFPKIVKNEQLILKNDFSVTTLDVPVKRRANLDEIKKRCKELRNSADPLTNYYFLKIVCSVLSKSILKPLLNSSQATMVFSNMPGPSQLDICGGNTLQSLVFFVPLKGTTGLGVTALCYGGVLRFAAMADAALVPTSDNLAVILNGMVGEIERMHKKYVK